MLEAQAPGTASRCPGKAGHCSEPHFSCLFFFFLGGEGRGKVLRWVLSRAHGTFRLHCSAWASSLVTCELLVAACGVYLSDQGLNPGPLH